MRNTFLQFHNTSIYDSNNYHGPKWVKADQLSQVLASDFERTIKFDYKSGKVDKILVPSKSSLFVENIKKAMINTLQMTLKSDQAFYTLQEVQINQFYPCLQAKKRGTLTVFLIFYFFFPHARWVHRELAGPLTFWTSLCPTKGSK